MQTTCMRPARAPSPVGRAFLAALASLLGGPRSSPTGLPPGVPGLAGKCTDARLFISKPLKMVAYWACTLQRGAMSVGKASYDPIAGTEGPEVHATSASALFWPAVVAACAAASFACGWALAAAAQGRQPGVELAQAHLTHLGQRAQALGAPALSAVPHTPRLPPAQEDELWAVYDSILKTRRFVD